MGRPVHNLDIKNGGEAAKPLRANAEGIDLVENLDAEFLDLVLRAALFQLRHIDRAHQTFLYETNSLFCGDANANAQYPGRAPSSAQLRHPQIGRASGKARVIQKDEELGGSRYIQTK